MISLREKLEKKKNNLLLRPIENSKFASKGENDRFTAGGKYRSTFLYAVPLGRIHLFSTLTICVLFLSANSSFDLGMTAPLISVRPCPR